MKATMTHQKRISMWYKVNGLNLRGLKNTEIAKEVGIHRTTVSRYLAMTSDEFYASLKQRKNLCLKLREYYDFVKIRLESHPYFSASQIEDHLKEHYNDLPNVHSKTIYNFVMRIRKEHSIAKPKEHSTREYQKIPDYDYGYEAQVDFGVYNMQKQHGGTQRVWMFCMVLSRSRQKFVYMQTAPFTAASSVYAHQLAFEYFQGVPKTVLYDQDRVFMVDENLGDYLLTQDFSRYAEKESFEPVFCRAADPESKGKVENNVHFVKINFLRGREFVNLSVLNSATVEWLKRTGNGKKHATTRLIPMQEWHKEKGYLLPIKNKLKQLEENIYKLHKVLKDHTISFKGNFYSLPLGTYKDEKSQVKLFVNDDRLCIYDLALNIITSHALSSLKGQYIFNNDHKRDKSKNQEKRTIKVLELLGDSEHAKLFIDGIRKGKSRYLNDNLRYIETRCTGYDKAIMDKAIESCIENNMYNAKVLMEFAASYDKREKAKEPQPMADYKGRTDSSGLANAIPKQSDLDIYESIINA